MRARHLLAASISLLALAAVSAPAFAQDTPTKKKKKGDDDSAQDSKKKTDASASSSSSGPRRDPKGVTGISPFEEKVAKGQKLAVARSFTEAVAAFQDAITEEPNNPVGHYYRGEAEVLKGDLAEAEASYQTALRNAGQDDVFKAKAMFGLADLRERQGKMDDAKAAWADYGKFVAGHDKAKGYPATAGERQKVIDTHNDLATKYAEVKARIDAREKLQKESREKDAAKDAKENDNKKRK
jgi:tetratricopeptide (TPR) repeat protein